jgi:AraC family transcriptional regulator
MLGFISYAIILLVLIRKDLEKMDWIKSLQNAINFVENNLTYEIDLEEVAKIANSSTFNFQRVFSILCGYTLGEYIRNRRLSLAGSELASTSQKVIDIALKYGYESPESFTRAFVRFHGINPSQVKKNGGSLKVFSKISVKLILDGGSLMDYRIEKHDEFKIISKKKYFPIEIEESQKQIPKFWTQCQNDKTITTLVQEYLDKDTILSDAIIGTCFEKSDRKNEFPYGISVFYNGNEVKRGFEVDTIPALNWAKFKCVGPMPTSIQKLLQTIYSEFFPSSEYKPSGDFYLELYPEGDISKSDYESEVWISVEKKD